LSVFKEDIEEAKERLMAWWNHEIIDRPCIQFYYVRNDVKFEGIYDFWHLAKFNDDIEGALDDFEIKSRSLYFGAENIPTYFLNYGPGILAALFGATMKFMSDTVWFSRSTSPDEIVDLLEKAEMNHNNTWYTRLMRVTEYAARRARSNYSVSITDLGGVLDILSSLLGSTNLILLMKRQPSIIDTSRAIILDKLTRVYDDLHAIINQYQDGCTSWLNVWCPQQWYPIQSDFSAMLSPKYFKRFALPDIVTQAERLDYAIYHLDGINQLPFVEDLLKVDSIDGIQWVPGAGKDPKGSERWMPIYKKIQKAGKNIVIDNFDGHPKYLSLVYNNLDPRGLIMGQAFISKRMALKFLPKFFDV
jgi:hypothetical protein